MLITVETITIELIFSSFIGTMYGRWIFNVSANYYAVNNGLNSSFSNIDHLKIIPNWVWQIAKQII